MAKLGEINTNTELGTPPFATSADASETVKGIAEIATQVETDAGTDDLRFVTPLKLANYPFPSAASATEISEGVAEIATQSEVDSGTDDQRFITPLKLANYPGLITPAATETVEGKAEIATQAETDAGTDDSRIVTPLKLATYSGSFPPNGSASGDLTGTYPGPTITTNAVSNTKLADMAANTVKANPTAGAADPQDFSIGTNTVLGRSAGNIVAAQLATGQVANNAITNTKLADMAQALLKGRASGAGTGDPQDLTASQVRTIINVADGANNYSHPNHTGDVTSTGDGAQTITDDAVTNAKLADVPTATFKGRTTASAGDPEDLTATQATALLNTFTTTLKGVVPAPGTVTGKFLKDDGTWATISGTGDVTAGANITDNRIIRGDGGAKGIQDSLWSIADSGQMTFSGAITDWAMSITNTQVTGGAGRGLRVLAGESLGDIIFHLSDQDSSFGGTGGCIMEVEADQGHITFFKTYAQTLIDRGVVYGLDNQNSGVSSDFNTQFGLYRVGGNPVATGDSVSGSSTITTTSTGHVLATGMTITPPAGTYMVTWSASVSSNQASADTYIQIYAAGGAEGVEHRFERGDSSTDNIGGLCVTAKVTVDGSEAIEGRWRTNTGTGEMYGRTLSIISVAP